MQVMILCYLLYTVHGDTLWYYINTVRQLHAEAATLAEEIAGTLEAEAGIGLGAGQPGKAYAQDGSLLSVWKGNGSACRVPLQDMPQAVIDAAICMEDNRFYSHRGVDFLALLRAALAMLQNHGEITQGGSTITMQLARTMCLTPEVSWQRKLEEIFIAWKLEKMLSKNQILELYLNHIYFGNGYYGIGSASIGYFEKNITNLSLGELIYLCAIPNNPTRYDPLTNSANTEKRKALILGRMAEDGYLTAEEHSAASSYAIVLAKPETAEKNDYVQTYAEHCAVQTLMELSGFYFRYDFPDAAQREAYEAEYEARYTACRNRLYTEGYRIYTSLDLGLQRQLQDAVNQELSEFPETNAEGVYALQGAAVCIDNRTGLVEAIVGGRSQDFDTYTLNRAYQSFRQPGSAIKPLVVYTPSFERGCTPDTMVEDRAFDGGPRNATGRYEGLVTVRYAVEQSVNTVAWKLFETLTPKVGLSYLTRMEFSKIVPEDYGLPSALGGLTLGVSPLEMAAAYAAIENGGVFRRPSCITRIEDADGNPLYEADASGKRVYTQEAADTMEDVLASVMENGTGKTVKLNQFCAGKTGTTNDWKDCWFVGYTQDYTTSVWVGYDLPRTIGKLQGPSYAGFVWKRFMDAVYPQDPPEP